MDAPEEEDDYAAAEEELERFIARVRETSEVWALHSEADGWANCPSVEDDDGDVILFWSDRELAKAHKQEEWSEHQPTPINLDDFINNWLQGMDEDGVMAGPDWAPDLSGFEISAQELAARLLGVDEEEDDEE